MLSRWTHALWVMALLAIGAVPAGAQCAPANGNSTWLVRLVKKYAYPHDASWAAARDSLRISPPAATGVVLITKAATCKSANTAYQKAVTGNRATLSGQVHVVQSGTTYVVWDPTYRYTTGANRTYMVFSSSWVLRRNFQ
jgi:hypothetical protein